MSGQLTPSGNQFINEVLSYTDDTNNIKLTGRFTAYSETGKIYSIADTSIIIDDVNQGNFNVNTNEYDSDKSPKININNINAYYTKLVGETIGAFIAAAEEYFKPQNV